MTDRRKAHCARRRGRHAELRKTAVVRQEHESSREGSNDSGYAQKAQANLKSRKALRLRLC
jgi:hypothetical protein